MFIINLTYKKELSQIEDYLEEHIQFLEKYYAKGNFMYSGRKVPRTGGIIICEATNIEEVNSIIKEDPFFINEIASYEIIEFIPSMIKESLK